MPVLLIIGFVGALGYHRFGRPGLYLGVVFGALIAWVWWSFAVPRWRDCVEARGLRPDDVQTLAVQTGLIWPRGSWPERTEFRRRDGRRGW